jgi:hypothetical protein
VKYYFKIKHIRDDYDVVFVGKPTNKYLNDNSMRYYFTKFKYSICNRVVDRVIQTIWEMIDRLGPSASLLNEDFVQQVVQLNNHTKHYAHNSKFSPAKA